MVPFKVNCTIPTLSKSKLVRGKYCIVLLGEGTVEKKSSRPIQAATQPFLVSSAYPRMRQKNSNIPCVGSPEYSMQSNLIDHSGWTRVIGKILALNQRHFDTEKNYVPSGIIFDWLFMYGTCTSSCICC